MDMAALYEKHKETLARYANAMRKTIWRVPLPDAMSEANMAFMEAVKDYDPAKGGFLTWLYGKCCARMQEMRRKATTLFERTTLRCGDMDWLPIVVSDFALEGLLEGLSGDGEDAVLIALQTPPGGRKEARMATKAAMRRLGWGRKRIKAAFAEIRTALRGY